MANKTDRLNPMFKVEDRSSATERRDRQIFNDIRKERTDTDAKTERLKALRLEKEAADAAAAAAPTIVAASVPSSPELMMQPEAAPAIIKPNRTSFFIGISPEVRRTTYGRRGTSISSTRD